MGRKTKLTKDIQEKLVSAIAHGNYHEVACFLVGIGSSTFYSWMKKGEEENSKRIYRDFVEAIKKAEAIAEAQRLQVISKASHENWQAAAWYLERRYPDRWGRRKHELEHKGELDLNIVVDYGDTDG